MTVTPSPLQLLDFVVGRMDYAYRPIEGEADVSSVSQFHFDGARFGDEAFLSLHVTLNRSEAATPERQSEVDRNPHTAEVKVSGRFLWEGEDVPDREAITVVNGLSILYGIARVLVAQASAAGPGGRFMLPVYSFRDIELELRDLGDDDSVDGGKVTELD